MLRLVLKKLAANRWLTACLLAGIVLAAALVAGIPVYSAGILQRLLTRDLERSQESTGVFPGRYTLSASFHHYSAAETNTADFPAYDSTIRDRLRSEVGIPILAAARELTVDFLEAHPEVRREQEPRARGCAIEALEGAEGKMRMLAGRMFSNQPVDGTIEVVVAETAYKSLDLLLGEVYRVMDLREMRREPLRVRVVGVFAMADPGDPWWFRNLRDYEYSLLADYGLVRRLFIEASPVMLTGARWSYALDYHTIRVPDLGRLAGVLERHAREAAAVGLETDIPMLPIIRAYAGRARALTTTLWFLQAPVFLMLAFFVLMTTRLIVRHDADDIAVIKSRGARSGQVFAAYALEGLLLAGFAAAAGPPLGLLGARIVGAANGFLEFVRRTALPVALTPRAWAAGAGAALVAAATMLVPAWRASRTTIVAAKRLRSRSEGAPAWSRAFLDLALLAMAGYGYYGYRTQQKVLALTRVDAGVLPIDPLLFLVSVCFIAGAGLLALRLYPLAIALVHRLGRRAWPPGLYATILGVARGGGREQFLMLFLVLTLGIGVLDAKTARTLNRNIEERIRYATGADVTLLEHWETNQSRQPGGPAGAGTGSSGASKSVIYLEPDFEKYRNLAGVESLTKVFRQPRGFLSAPGVRAARTVVMGIVPDEFSRVAWFRAGLLPHHQNQYLNLLAQSPAAMLVSENLAKRLDLAPGDPVEITWEGRRYADGVVYAVVPWWPTWNPHGTGQDDPPGLVVANLKHLQAALGVEPYEVWMKLAAGAGAETLYRQLEERGTRLVRVASASQDLVAARNDPLVQGTNGALTLGFSVTMLVAVIGFLIYWIVSVQSRVLQFGVLRAIGMPRRAVLGMIVWEQLLVSGVAIAIGVAIGSAAGDIFVPLLQLTSSAAGQVPPFRVVAERADYLRVYAVAGGMLVVGLAVLMGFVLRLRVAQAVKLGEE